MPLMTIVFVENTITWTSTAVTDTIYRYYYIYKDSYEED
jgi:predicted carbohydrate-binding protein with CBM5 and CBM33 domain